MIVFVATLIGITLTWIVRHLERRLQHVEHEIASLHLGLPVPNEAPTSHAGFNAPTTPEVARRYAAMVEQGSKAA